MVWDAGRARPPSITNDVTGVVLVESPPKDVALSFAIFPNLTIAKGYAPHESRKVTKHRQTRAVLTSDTRVPPQGP